MRSRTRRSDRLRSTTSQRRRCQFRQSSARFHCWAGLALWWLASEARSLQIGPDKVDQFFAQVGRERSMAVLEQVQADVILKDLGHQAVDASAHGGKQHQDLGAVVIVARERDRKSTRLNSSHANIS